MIEKTEEELKSCPFCGNKAEMSIEHGRDYAYFSICVQCTFCLNKTRTFSVSPFIDETKHAIESWNKRV